MNNDEPKKPALTIDEIRLAKESARAKIGQAIHEATIDFVHETGLAITGITVNMPELGGRARSYGLGGVEIEIERI